MTVEKKNSTAQIAIKSTKKKEIKYQPYEKALAFARGLGLSSVSEWKQFCKEGKCPKDIPVQPNKSYKEWLNFNVWLGIPEQKIEKVVKITKQLEKMIYIYNDSHSAKNLLYFGWAEGTYEDLEKIKDFDPNLRINILKRYTFEPGIEEFIVNVINLNSFTIGLTSTDLYNKPIIVNNPMNVFFEFDNAFLPFGFKKPGV